MVSELERVVAYVFRSQRREALSKREFRHHLSLGLRWYAPAEAAALLQRALEAGFLRLEGDTLRPAFDVEDVELPLGFKGSRRALEERLPAAPPGASSPPSPAPAPVAGAPAPAKPASSAGGAPAAASVAAGAARVEVARARAEDPAEAGPVWPGPHRALLDRAPAERVQAMRATSQGRLGEDAARLLALRERGTDVRGAAKDALAARVRKPEAPSDRPEPGAAR